jgi:hypothetical protein
MWGIVPEVGMVQMWGIVPEVRMLNMWGVGCTGSGDGEESRSSPMLVISRFRNRAGVEFLKAKTALKGQ